MSMILSLLFGWNTIHEPIPPPFRVMHKKSAVTRISASRLNHPQNAETSPNDVRIGTPHSSRFVPPAEELFTLPFQS